MGRAIAQRFAIDYPERTLGLVLMGAFGGEARNPVVVEIEEAVSMLTDPVDAQAAIIVMSLFTVGESFIILLVARHALPAELYELAAIEDATADFKAFVT